LENMDKEFIVNFITSLLGVEPYALLSYGSRVAGYATEKSDYDYIVILEEFNEKIKYLYKKIYGDKYASLLLVDKEFMEEDVLEGRHGEFVSGRLYNVYNPIINKDYIYNLEKILKKRAILEEICFLKNVYHDLLPYLKIPLKYILLSRLKKRMFAYPPVKYSYFKTYYGPLGNINFKKSLEGFKNAAKELDKEGYLRYIDGYIKIDDIKRIPCELSDIIKVIARGFKMYLTHSRSAKVNIHVVFEEISSKVRRSTEALRIPNELSEPDILLELDYGKLVYPYVSIDKLLKGLFGYKVKISSIKRCGLFSELYFIDLKYNNFSRRYVYKKYSYLYLFKWMWIVLWLLGLKKLSLLPHSRMINEYKGYYVFKKYNYNIPEFHVLLWRNKAILTEYLDGVTVNKLSDDEAVKIYKEVGKFLGKVHKELGVCIGDFKPNNVMLVNNRLYIIDLEQFGLDNNFSWDIGEFLYYTFNIGSKRGRIEDICISFLDGYRDFFMNDEYLANLLKNIISLRFIIAFCIITPIHRIIKIRRCIKEYINRLAP